MYTTKSDVEDAITHDEIEGTAPDPTSAAIPPTKRKRDAFTELMAPKPKPTTTTTTTSKGTRGPGGRDGLGVYLVRPEAFPPSRVLYHDADFVAIRDLYPKSSIHCLLLPRSPRHSRQHPFDALEDPAFLASVRAATARLSRLVALELQRTFGSSSVSEAARDAALEAAAAAAAEQEEEEEEEEDGNANANGNGNGDQLPPGRDWEAEVKVGVHAHPSMSHLHVHVLSREMYSPALKHRKHYNSFNTPFLVDVADFPLAKDDPRRNPGKEGYLRSDFECWRCGKNFGNRFQKLKEHLNEEFEAWKTE